MDDKIFTESDSVASTGLLTGSLMMDMPSCTSLYFEQSKNDSDTCYISGSLTEAIVQARTLGDTSKINKIVDNYNNITINNDDSIFLEYEKRYFSKIIEKDELIKSLTQRISDLEKEIKLLRK